MRHAMLPFSGTLLVSFSAWAGPAEDDFANRCADPDVVKCVSFDVAAEVDPFVYPPSGEEVKRGIVDTDVRASGDGSLRFEIPSNTGADTSGSFWQNFSDDLTVQFGEGEEFYVQWRQRFSPEFVSTAYEGGGGWKQVIIGEGDRPDGSIAYSCTTLEVVTVNGYHRGFPSMYHSCGVKDGQYEGLEEPVPPYDFLLQNAVRDPGCLYSLGNEATYVPPCVGYVPDEWMTFQVHVAIGTWYQNDGVYHHDSTIQQWVGREGETSQMTIDFSPKDAECQGMQQSLPGCQTGYDLVNDNPDAKYGKVWLLPYNTGKDPAASHPTAYTWFDELVISRAPIPDPGAAPPPGSDESGDDDGGVDSDSGDVDDGDDDGVGETAASADDDDDDGADSNAATDDGSDSDAGAAGEDAAGCGCRTDHRAGGWFLVLFVLALRRRAECKRSTKP